MSTKPFLHLIHPTLQFEAKHALRLLNNLLETYEPQDHGRGDLFGAVAIFATERDLKNDFAPLSGKIDGFEFTWNGNTLDCTSETDNRFRHSGTFSVFFGNSPCNFLGDIWDCPIAKTRQCVHAAVKRLANVVADFQPASDGGVAARFETLVRRYRLTPRERDLLLVGLCDAHGLLEYGLDGLCLGRSFLTRMEESAAYLGCGVDDVLPLVRNDSKLIACGLLDNDLTPTREALEYLEGHVVAPGITARRIDMGSDDDLEDSISEDDWE